MGRAELHVHLNLIESGAEGLEHEIGGKLKARSEIQGATREASARPEHLACDTRASAWAGAPAGRAD